MSSSSDAKLLPAGARFFLRSGDRKLVDSMEQGLGRVEDRLRVESANANPVADAASRYLLDAGGKRVRPLLALLVSQLGSGITDDVIAAAVSLELVHVATLYHDDVMDDADVRRGVPSAQRLWGNNTAILAGDILFARASKLIAHLDPRVVVLQAETFERLCLGQMNETIGPRDGDDPIAHYLDVLAGKTGSLISAAGQVGAILGGQDDATIAAIHDYGEAVGLAFQLADDVIDLRTPGEESGKTPGTDLREGVSTMPMLLLQRNAKTNAADAATLAKVQQLLADDSTLQQALDVLASHPVTEATLDEAKRYSEVAKGHLAQLPDSSIKRALVRLADYVVTRSK